MKKTKLQIHDVLVHHEAYMFMNGERFPLQTKFWCSNIHSLFNREGSMDKIVPCKENFAMKLNEKGYNLSQHLLLWQSQNYGFSLHNKYSLEMESNMSVYSIT